MKNTVDKGSAHAIIIVVLVVALLGTLGLVFYQNFIEKSGDKKTADSAQDTPAKTDTTPKVDEEAKSNEGYLVIDNWGVKFKIPESLNNEKITYKASESAAEGGEGYDVTTEKALAAANSDMLQARVLIIERHKKPLLTDTGEIKRQTPPYNLEKIGDYYYYYSPTSGQVPAGLTSEAYAGFTELAKSIEKK